MRVAELCHDLVVVRRPMNQYPHANDAEDEKPYFYSAMFSAANNDKGNEA